MVDRVNPVIPDERGPFAVPPVGPPAVDGRERDVRRRAREDAERERARRARRAQDGAASAAASPPAEDGEEPDDGRPHVDVRA